MKIFIETPKWSFVKYKREEGKFKKALFSPFPTIFNYGFVIGTKAEDGMPIDAIVLGRKLPQGMTIDCGIAGIVQFEDGKDRDDKYIGVKNSSIGLIDRVKIGVFFRIYAIYKTIYHMIVDRRLRICRFGGVILYYLQ